MNGDLCDKCGAQAYVITVIDNGLPLAWCAHHAREYDEALSPYVVQVQDERHLLEA